MPVNDVRAYAHAMIHTAAVWDLLGTSGVLPPWWPPVSYVLAALGIAAACTGALLVMLATRRYVPAAEDGARPAPPRSGIGVQLLATGVLLAAWVLRGDAEIPPDPPLVAAEVLAAALYAFVALRRPVLNGGA